MEDVQTAPLADREHSDAELFALSVEYVFEVHADGAGALVQNGELWLVVKDSRETDSLTLTSGQDVDPVVDLVEASFSVVKMSELDLVENIKKFVVAHL